MQLLQGLARRPKVIEACRETVEPIIDSSGIDKAPEQLLYAVQPLPQHCDRAVGYYPLGEGLGDRLGMVRGHMTRTTTEGRLHHPPEAFEMAAEPRNAGRRLSGHLVLETQVFVRGVIIAAFGQSVRFVHSCDERQNRI